MVLPTRPAPGHRSFRRIEIVVFDRPLDASEVRLPPARLQVGYLPLMYGRMKARGLSAPPSGRPSEPSAKIGTIGWVAPVSAPVSGSRLLTFPQLLFGDCRRFAFVAKERVGPLGQQLDLSIGLGFLRFELIDCGAPGPR